MALKFEKNKRAFVSDLNNLAVMNVNAVRSGCQVVAHSPPNMGVRVQPGSVFFGTNVVSVAQQDVAISPSHHSFDRIDLIVINSSGVASVITGTPEINPHTPDYDPFNYVVLARIFVDDLVTSITSNAITDIRVINEAVGTFGKYTELVNEQSFVSVVHNLGDSSPIVACYDDTNQAVIPYNITIISDNQLNVEFNPPFTGIIVVQGGAGGTITGGTTYIHTQGVSALSWIINHNLNQEVVLVQCYDAAGKMIIPHQVQIDSHNQITVTFLNSESGKAIVKK